MSDKITQLKEDRAKVVEAQQTINDLAVKENREFTADEKASYEKADQDFDRLSDEIKAEETRMLEVEDRQKKLNERQEFIKRHPGPTHIDLSDSNPNNRQEDRFTALPESRHYDAIMRYRQHSGREVLATRAYNDAFCSYLVGGLTPPYSIMNREERSLLEMPELRALQADSDTTGGFLVVPEDFINRLIMAKDNLLFIRRNSTVIPVPNAASLGVPSLDADPGDATWTAEIATGSNDSTMRFGKRELHPHPLARRIKVSKKLLRVARMNVGNLVNNRLAYKFATVEENAFQNGNGSNQPLGVFTASNDGIPTSRDVSTGNTSTAITADGLINCKYDMPAQYRTNCRWLFHRSAIKMIRKLKDGEGNYIWRQGLATDRPDTILDFPFDESEYTPSTFTTGLYVGIFGDWSNYWIADALNMQVQTLTELYAETNQNGYIGRAEVDGMPVMSAAFRRVKLA